MAALKIVYKDARSSTANLPSGEMSSQEFIQFLNTVLIRLAEFSSDGSLHFICMDWRHMRELLDAVAKPYSEIKNLCVWSKTNAGMGSLYRSQHADLRVQEW
jgi:hypothetical protein